MGRPVAGREERCQRQMAVEACGGPGEGRLVTGEVGGGLEEALALREMAIDETGDSRRWLSTCTSCACPKKPNLSDTMLGYMQLIFHGAQRPQYIVHIHV
jgi:hypothetical protein